MTPGWAPVFFERSVTGVVALVRFVYGRFPVDLAPGGSLPPASIGLSSASAERACPGSKAWRIEAPAPSRSEENHHPSMTCLCEV